MFIPAHICKALYDMQPDLRMCWIGKRRKNEGDINPGSFGICQLYHNSNCGTPDEPQTYREFWDVEMKHIAGSYHNVRVNRGVLFNREGTSERDFDPLFYTPMFIVDLEHKDFGLTKYDIFGTKFLRDVRRWLSPMYDRTVKSTNELGAEMNRRAADTAERAADYNWWLANQTSETGPRIARKHRKDEIQRIGQTAERGVDFRELMAPPKA